MFSHVAVVTVVVSALPCTLVGALDVATPEQKAMDDEGADLEQVSVCTGKIQTGSLTAALAMNMENANVPVSLGTPYFSSADVFRTPSVKTSVMGYDVPLAIRRSVDMKGSDFESQPLP